MKRVVVLIMAVMLLAGCAGGVTVMPTISAMPSQSASGTAKPTASPTPLPTTTPEPSKPVITIAQTPSPMQDDSFTDVWVLDTNEQNGSRLSGVAVTDGKAVYYRSDVGFNSNKDDYRYDYYTRIMKYDPKTGKSNELLNTKKKGFIFNLYLRENGTLYYTMGENICPDKPLCLYRYQGGKSTLLQKDISSVLYAVDDVIYYKYDVNVGNYSNTSQYFSYNLVSGDKTTIPVDETVYYRFPYEKYRIMYCIKNDGTDFKIIDYNKDKQTLCHIKEKLIGAREAFIYNGTLFIVDYDEDKQQSTIFKISLDQNIVLSAITINGDVDDEEFYQDKWYFYTSRENKDEAVIDERLNIYDLSSGKITLLTKLNIKNGNHLTWANIEAGCGYIWVYCGAGGDGLYYDFIQRVKIP